LLNKRPKQDVKRHRRETVARMLLRLVGN